MLDVTKLTDNDKLMAGGALLAIVLFSALVYVYRSKLFASSKENLPDDESDDESDDGEYEPFSGYS